MSGLLCSFTSECMFRVILPLACTYYSPCAQTVTTSQTARGLCSVTYFKPMNTQSVPLAHLPTNIWSVFFSFYSS